MLGFFSQTRHLYPVVETSHDINEAVVVSDLHIGLPYFRKSAFVQFVDSLHAKTALILNGDIIDNPHQQLIPEDALVVDFLREQSFKRKVVWIYGNHDENFRMSDPGQIEFRNNISLRKRLMIIHGDDFDQVMPKSLLFIRFFKFCHRIRLRLGAAPIHVAELAKRWTPFLYRVLTEEVKKNAVDCAVEGGFGAITCGHTHYPEDSMCEGIRYINTGSWTEEPLHYLAIRNNDLRLVVYEPDSQAPAEDTQMEEQQIAS